jgi:predicted enzyme related to lactoylglutathione lyase
VEPYVDAPYYVGFRTGAVEIGLDPHGHQSGLDGPVAYWEVPDLDAAVAGLVESGAELRSPAREVGGGKRVAVLADLDGNLTGLSQTA